MKTNPQIIQEVIEQIVNQHQIEAWDRYFSPEYIAHGAPFIGIGFSVDSAGDQHIFNYIVPGSPAEGVLQAGDELLWVQDEGRRWATYADLQQGISQGYRGRQYTFGIRRGDQTLELELTRGLVPGYDTPNDQAKAEMRQFMTEQFPDLTAAIQLILTDGDLVVSLLQYRGTHATYQREAIWREAWIARLSDGLIVESWPIIDESPYLRQLGYQLIPPRD